MNERPLTTVGGLIVASDGEIFLMRSKKWHDLYSLPGGKVEWGETREQAFMREIWEETQLKVVNLRFAIVQDCIFSSEYWKKNHFVMNDFIADLDPSFSKKDVKLNDEAYEFLWISPQSALTLPLHHECRYLIEWYISHCFATPRMGMIGIHRHQIKCIMGIEPEERLKEQTLYVDLKLKRNLSACLKSGDIKDSIDYVKLAQLCTRLARQKKYYLLETFAADILDQCLKQFDIKWGWVKIQKPVAIPGAEYAYVELETE